MKISLQMVLLILLLFGSTFLFGQQNYNSRLITFEENDLRGYADATGKVVIKPRFRLAWEFSEDLALVSDCTDKGIRLGFIDKGGNFIIEPQFRDAKDFSEGLAGVMNDERKWGFVDKKGEWAIAPQFEDYISSDYKFSEGLAVIRFGEKYGYIDKSGNLIIKPQFDSADGFSEGLASVEINDKYGFIDKTGSFVIKPQFDLAVGFYEGFGRVNIGYRFGWNDQDLNRREGLWGYIDKTGKIVIPARYDFADDFSEGLAYIRVGEKEGFIDKTGKVAIKVKFDGVKKFSEGLAAVEVGDKWGYIDRSGKIVISPRFYDAYNFKGGIAAVNIGVSYIDKSGKFVWNEEDKKTFTTKPCASVDTPSQSQKQLTEKDLKRRAEIYEKMLKGEYLHDGALELQYIGDISSVPALLVVLKNNPPSKNGTMICTSAHALQALRKITNANPGITYEEWNQWWENYKKEQTAKTEQ